MNMQFIGKLPIPQEIKAQYPLSEEAMDIKFARDNAISKVFSGEDDRMVLVIGLQTGKMRFWSISANCALCRIRCRTSF